MNKASLDENRVFEHSDLTFEILQAHTKHTCMLCELPIIAKAYYACTHRIKRDNKQQCIDTCLACLSHFMKTEIERHSKFLKFISNLHE